MPDVKQKEKTQVKNIKITKLICDTLARAISYVAIYPTKTFISEIPNQAESRKFHFYLQAGRHQRQDNNFRTKVLGPLFFVHVHRLAFRRA